MEFDPKAFEGTARYYVEGRPPYSPQLERILKAELSLNGSGHLVDVGCGPATLTLTLAGLFDRITCIDPEPDMLLEASKQCRLAGISGVTFVQAKAEDLPTLDVAGCSLVTFGQSFHRVRQLDVAEAVHGVLAPGGSVVMIANVTQGRPKPDGPGLPEIPHEAIRALIVNYLGQKTADYLATWKDGPVDRFQDTLARSSFGGSRTVFAPGQPDLVRDVNSIVSMYFSMSFSAPRLFGDRKDQFEADLRALLLDGSESGQFWEWPGDTEIVIATRR